MSLFNWKLKKEELNNQIDNYHTLKWTKSYRKISAVLIWVSVIITVLFAMFTDLATGSMAAAVLLVYLPISIFVYRGYRWALWSIIVIWTIDKFYMLSQSPSGGIIQLIWWAIYMSAFVGAIQIENTKARLNKSAQVELAPITNNVNKIKFCSKCGEKATKGGQQFCTKCGNKFNA